MREPVARSARAAGARESRGRARVAGEGEPQLSQLRVVQPRGPYFLAGYCAGGFVAYEMLVAVRDAPGRGTGRGSSPSAPRAKSGVGRAPRSSAISGASRRPSPWPTAGLGAARSLTRSGIKWLTRAFLKASTRYALRPFPGRLHLFRARESGELFAGLQDDLGWADYGAGGLTVRDIPGDHHSLMREPNVQLLAAELAEALRASEPNPLSPSAKSGVERS